MIRAFKLDGFLAAYYHEAEFISKKSVDFGDRYNPNPDFYKKIMDTNTDIDLLEEIDVPLDSELPIRFPWSFCGSLYLDGNKAYIIDHDEWGGYAEIIVSEPIKDKTHLLDLIENAMKLTKVGYVLGYQQGWRDKAKEVQKALSVMTDEIVK